MASAQATHAAPSVRASAVLVPGAIFLSAALVFLVQPMMARLLTPVLGGAPAVWNTSLVFFQAALLVGYAYAHALQRLRSVRLQGAVHVVVLLAAALALPLRASGVFGEPPAGAPQLWLLGVLAVSLGAPFAALSATAPLLQAWWAAGRGETANPYPLYAASNLGSLAALLGYPLAVEPWLAMEAQRLAWTAGYAAFVAAAVAVALTLPRTAARTAASVERTAAGTRWRRRAWWAFLGAAPSSLLIGVTTHITADIASAPFLWVLPLALYLLTFVLAFAERPPIPPGLVLLAQAVAAPVTLSLTPINLDWWYALPLHLGTFFLTAMMCHQRVASDRPEPARLTEFYLALSVGGVVGGALTALAAPVLFDRVWEYPLALALAGFARWGGALRPRRGEMIALAAGLAAAAVVGFSPGNLEDDVPLRGALLLLALCAMLVRANAPAHVVLLAAMALVAGRNVIAGDVIQSERSFFGVYRVSERDERGLGMVRTLTHGTTLHGAEAPAGDWRGRPLTYYAPTTAIGSAVAAVQARGPTRIGVVGLGAGSLAAYLRPGDSLRFFEIDPLVERLARERFGYLAAARAPVDVVLGDARLTVGREPAGSYDVLVIDAFSSDAVPTHLMTVEAMRVWLRALKPHGVVVLHISNRNLELEAPAAAALRAAGAVVAAQLKASPRGTPRLASLTTQVVIGSRDPAAIARLKAADAGWREPVIDGVRPWTDDRINVLEAMLRQ